MFQEEEPAARYPPNTDPPGKGVHLTSNNWTGAATHPPSLPYYMGRTFPATCEFWLLTREWTTVYYVSGRMPIRDRVSLHFARGIFQRLLAWSDKLHTMLVRGDKSSHHSIIFQ